MDGELHRALHRACAEAHARHLRAEQLLVAFKQVCFEVDEVRQGPSRSGANEVLDELVRLCIEEYYR